MAINLIPVGAVVLICVAFWALHHSRRAEMSADERRAEDEEIERERKFW